MNPTLRRAIIQFGAKEKLNFTTALECLVSEGFKAEAHAHPAKFAGVCNPVNKWG